MKLCELCQGSIKDGEEYESHDKLSTSAAGHTVFRHKVCPSPPPYRSAPRRWPLR